MATDLILPRGAFPSNLHLSAKVKYAEVESDMFDICDRIAEVSPYLYIIDLEDDDAHSYAIMEDGLDGTQYLVFKVRELDARILPDLRRLAALSLQERIEAADKENYEWELSEKERKWEEFYEESGRGFYRDLEQAGFLERPTSYPKRGVKPRRG